jgi:hypothetical protein
MHDPFEQMSSHDFFEALEVKNWSCETRLHTPTFEAVLKAEGTLFLRGIALHEGFALGDVQALTRFLGERVPFPPVPPPSDFAGYTPLRVETESE